jgi:hypothetical protein
MPAAAQSSQRARYEEWRNLQVEWRKVLKENCDRAMAARKNYKRPPGALYDPPQPTECSRMHMMGFSNPERWSDCEPMCQTVTMGMINGWRQQVANARAGR